MACLRRNPWTLVLLLAPVLTARADDSQGIDAAALFARACAACHGLDGSGTGPSVLDRPARNFKEGGFSFGNTPEAIERTLAHGIPGSPMSSFDGALTEAERRALAEYVITLGPPIKEVTEAETLMVVKDRPLIVRGILPPLVEDGPKIPRGLLIGTPDGLTFEYDVDDVRLLAVRAGDFVKRTDWGGRGGTPLEPLGKVVWSDLAGNPPQRWNLARAERVAADDRKRDGSVVEHLSPLRALLRSTSVHAGVPRLDYDLYIPGAADDPVATVHESVRFLAMGPLSGFVRTIEVDTHPGGWSVLALVAQDAAAGAQDLGLSARTGVVGQLDAPDDGLVWWFRSDSADGSIELTGLTKLIGNGHASSTGDQPDPPTGPALWFSSAGGKASTLRGEIYKLMASAWTPEVPAALELLSTR